MAIAEERIWSFAAAMGQIRSSRTSAKICSMGSLVRRPVPVRSTPDADQYVLAAAGQIHQLGERGLAFPQRAHHVTIVVSSLEPPRCRPKPTSVIPSAARNLLYLPGREKQIPRFRSG